jgi:3'-phosphoadenosine 5'-phosphosulfate sulfotransferase (PAPS reductase)/FAD synthetase
MTLPAAIRLGLPGRLMRYVVSFSGGVASWAAAKRLRETVPASAMTLLFADTKIEDEDTYRFLVQAASNLSVPLTVITEGRTPWEVFRDERFIANTRVDLCSRILKRDLLDAWNQQHAPDAITVVGLTAEEASRLERFQKAMAPRPVIAPLCDWPPLEKADALDWATAEGLRLPRLYGLGFKHNNCGGFCVKAGHEQFALLHRVLPHRFREHEQQEEQARSALGDVAILRDRRGGQIRPLPLRELRRRIEAQESFDGFGGADCACFDPSLDEPGPVERPREALTP